MGGGYYFGRGKAPAGFTAVAPGTTFTVERGFGFESGASSSLFSIAVPEGNWRVTAVLGGDRASSTTIKAESRRLMLEEVAARAGRTVTRSFVVNVRNDRLPPPEPNAPGGDRVRISPGEQGSFTWDDKLTLEVCGPTAQLQSVSLERADVPTVYLAGDSTVTDQRWEPAASWGQMFPRFFGDQVAIANHAQSGETLKSFLTGLRLDKLLSAMKAGDWLFIQFGHNDSKSQWPQTYVPAESTYRDYLKAYIGEARRRGAHPVLVTSPHRRRFQGGRIVNTHGAYPEAVRIVGRETGVPVIDLLDMSARFYEALGPERAPLAFNDGGKDATHHNNYGAYMLARCVVQGIRDAGLPLAALLASDVGPFDPGRPPPPESFTLPASLARSSVRPAGN